MTKLYFPLWGSRLQGTVAWVLGRNTGFRLFRRNRSKAHNHLAVTDYDRGVVAATLMLAHEEDPAFARRYLASIPRDDARSDSTGIIQALSQMLLTAERRKYLEPGTFSIEPLLSRLDEVTDRDDLAAQALIDALSGGEPSLGRKSDETIDSSLALARRLLLGDVARHRFALDLQASVGAVPPAYQVPLPIGRLQPGGNSVAHEQLQREVAVLSLLGPKTLVDVIFNVAYSSDVYRSKNSYLRAMQSLAGAVESTTVQSADASNDLELGWVPADMRPLVQAVRELNALLGGLRNELGGSACAVLDALDLAVCPTKDHHVVKLERSVA